MFGRQSFKVDGKHHFYGGVNIEAVGGGWGLVDQLMQAAERLGVEIRYGTGLTASCCRTDEGGHRRARHAARTATRTSTAKAVVLACGGFEANPEMRVRYLGPGWDLVPGARHPLQHRRRHRMPRSRSARSPFGGWSSCHAVQWDISAPPFGDRVVLDNFQKHSYPIGIIVNLDGERFVDEGADYRNHTYAKYGREVMKQPQRTAVQIFDAKTIGMRARRVPHQAGDQGRGADTSRRWPRSSSIDAEAWRDRRDFNAACQPGQVQPGDPRRRRRTQASRRRSPTGRCRSTSRPTSASSSPAASPSRSAACDQRSRRGAGHQRPHHPGPLCRGRAGRRHLLRELSGRHRPHVGRACSAASSREGDPFLFKEARSPRQRRAAQAIRA